MDVCSDSPDPGGLTPEELAILLKKLVRAKPLRMVCRSPTYDPTLDRDGVCFDTNVEIGFSLGLNQKPKLRIRVERQTRPKQRKKLNNNRLWDFLIAAR